MRIFLLFLTFMLSVSSGPLADDQPLGELQQANALLQAEYDLARDGKPYLLIDLYERQLLLKASGLTLQSWQVDDFRRWGYPPSTAAATLVSKSSLDDPERQVQVVNAAETRKEVVSKPFNALELADMPSAYSMRLENGTNILVRSVPVNWFAHISAGLAVSMEYLRRPLISSWNFLRSTPYNELALSMSEQDARMLYWAFNEGTPCLIRFPSAVPATAPSSAGTKR
jgi:hypothetical protein